MDRKGYFRWLCSKVEADRCPEYMRYSKLLSDLAGQEYRWDPTIESDANRADDGLNLRLLYFNETGNKAGWSAPCTVLEMLIAMSIRIEMDIMGYPGEDCPDRWFWETLGNLGLLEMTDDEYDPGFVDFVIQRWLTRTYKRNGAGGLFPLRKPSSDQRLVPIWDQMGEYLVERY